MQDASEKTTYLQGLAGRAAAAEQLAADVRRAHAESAAEFDRVKERLRRSQQDEVGRTRERMIAAFFEVGDSLDRSLEAAQSPSASLESLGAGVAMVRDQLFRALAELGVERFDPRGETFDPASHEAIGIVPVSDPALDGKVVEVLKPGYRAAGRVLRPALVQAGRLAS